jgi:putative hemolysin
MTWALLSFALLCQLASSLVSAAETACFTLTRARVRTLVEEGFPGAAGLATVRDRSSSIQASVLVLGTFLNVLAAGALVATAASLWGWMGAVWAVPVAAVLALLLGEVVPRGMATRYPIRLALRSAGPLLGLERRLGHLLRPVVRIEELLAGGNGDGASLEERELEEMALIGEAEGLLDRYESQLVERAFRLDELTAWDVMTPRVDMHTWRDSLTVSEIVEELPSVPHSRIPVYGESVDDVTGIVYIREVYQAYVAGRGDSALREIAREPFFLPGSLSLTRLLRDFQGRRLHMGIVADEFGGTDGLVTLEDVLEELVGEIEDETDIHEQLVTRLSTSEIEVDGSTELREVNAALGISLPYQEHRSMNGFLLEEMGEVPVAGERLEWEGAEIEIVEASETQVLRVRVRRPSTVGEEQG